MFIMKVHKNPETTYVRGLDITPIAGNKMSNRNLSGFISVCCFPPRVVVCRFYYQCYTECRFNLNVSIYGKNKNELVAFGKKYILIEIIL